MAESSPPLLSPGGGTGSKSSTALSVGDVDTELEASRSDLAAVGAVVSRLSPGLVRRRMEAALKEVDAEIQSQLWGHLRSSSSSSSSANTNSSSATGQRRVPTAAPTAAPSTIGTREAPSPAAAGEQVAPSDSPTGKILGMARRARVTPRSALHASALGLHCLLVKEGFVCTGQDDKAGKVTGFAAPIRDVPAEKLVPDRWDTDASAVSFRYRRPDQPGKVYLFKTAGSGPVPAAAAEAAASSPPHSGEENGLAQFFLGEKGGEIVSADVDLQPLQRRSGNFFESEDFFEMLFSVFRREVLRPVVPTTKTPSPVAGDTGAAAGENSSAAAAATAASAAARAEAERLRAEAERQPRPAIPDEDDPLRIGRPRFAGPPGVGPTPFVPGRGGDFGGDLFPGGVGGPGGGSGGGLPGPGGLLGPGHPMFGGGGGAGYMEPRFDPYGPPTPGQPWGPGVPGRGAGRGGSAQGGPRGPPGGPDNDHLRPPGGSGDMFF